MPIEVELPDGSIAEFPDGTDNATMERALSSYAAPRPKATMQSTKPKRGPDFSNVQSRTIGSTESTRESARTRKIRAQSEGEAYRAKLEAQRMEDGPGFRAGIGYSFAQTGQGIKQAATDLALINSLSGSAVLDSVGAGGLADLVRRRVASPLSGASNRYQQETGEMRQDMEPMQGSIAGQSGNIAGTAAQFIGPGFLARGTTAAPALAPRAISGNALHGMIFGGIQPTESQGERMGNAATGTIAGGGLAGLLKGGGALRNLWSNPVTSAERSAGGAIKEVLGGKPLGYTPSSTPGVTRELGEGTLNDGLMAQSDMLRATQRGEGLFRALDDKNNLARVAAIEKIAGTEADMAAAMARREAASAPFYERAKSVQVAADPPLKATLDRIPASVMRKAQQLAKMAGEQFPADTGKLSGGQLHYIKLSLDDSLSKAGQGSLGSTEKRIATELKNDLVSHIGRLIPDYATGSTNFQGLSKPVNRMQVGRELLDAGSATIRDAAGKPRIQPGTFAKANDMDEIAKRATGFKGSKASDILDANDLAVINSIQDDMQRQFSRQSTPSGGSQTVGRASLMGRMGEKFALSKIPKIGPYVQMLSDARQQATMEKLAYLHANPAEAQRVLAALDAPQRELVRRALVSIGSKAWVVNDKRADGNVSR